jgi:phage tail-like protein
MLMPRPFALIRTHDQWLRVAHEATALLGEVVQLAWENDKATSDHEAAPFTTRGAGLAFDQYCRLYHSVPDEGRVERLLWATLDSSESVKPVNLFASDGEMKLGEFVLSDDQSTMLQAPRGVVVDDDDRLFIGETEARQILIYDLWSNRLLRRVPLNAAPIDLAVRGNQVYALLADAPGLLKLDARSEPQAMAWPSELADPSRLAIAPSGELFILTGAGTVTARVWQHRSDAAPINLTFPTGKAKQTGDTLPFATDIEFQPNTEVFGQACTSAVLVAARRPGEDFRRFCLSATGVAEMPPLKARGYDGLGIVRTPDGRIGYWTAHGFAHAAAARLRYKTSGTVTTFRLDSGEFHTVWGRLFLDACIPRDTQIIVRCVTADEPPEDAAIVRSRPANTKENPPHKNLSPPMPPISLAQQFAKAPAQFLELPSVSGQRLHRRAGGRELPWVRMDEGDPYETYEAPILAEPGRFLWVRLELTGNTRTTPRLRAMRAEFPAHDYLRRLPKTFSRDEQAASFLHRYLGMFEGELSAWEAKAYARAMLLNPLSAPAEMLPWLAGFLGLTLDERMAHAPRPGGQIEDVRRTFIAEATWLFRFRGTVPGLRRWLEIYLGVEPIIIEKFRVRGLGGALLGDETGLASNSVLGAGFRIGGALGEAETVNLTGTIDDAFATHAHQFTVVIPAVLTSEQQDVVNQILEVHRPAHTLVEVCTVSAGMRVGRGLHVALTSILGPSGGFRSVQLGNATLGRGAILGRPEAGTILGSAQLGEDSRVG